MSGLSWHWNMLIGATANFVVVYCATISAGGTSRVALIAAAASTAAPFVGTPYQSFLNPDGTPAAKVYRRPGGIKNLSDIDFK
jgi:hypothetical protein